uniref:RNA helicase n=1 Tax=Romanomermis culicivorax TaxID=13658 RepID=A0A915L7A1_ROMCU
MSAPAPAKMSARGQPTSIPYQKISSDSAEEIMSDAEDYVPYVRVKDRRREKMLRQGLLSKISAIDHEEDVPVAKLENDSDDEEKKAQTSLLDQHTDMKKRYETESAKETTIDKKLQEEEKILESVAGRTALMAAAELAKGIQYKDAIKTSWRPPKYILRQSTSKQERLRRKYGVSAEGDSVPPLIRTFKEMKFNQSLIDTLKTMMKVEKPTPIQMQGLPVA